MNKPNPECLTVRAAESTGSPPTKTVMHPARLRQAGCSVYMPSIHAAVTNATPLEKAK